MHVFDRFGVVFKNAEVMDRIAVDGVAVDLLMIVEYTVPPERA
jgi:hypothetical protein